MSRIKIQASSGNARPKNRWTDEELADLHSIADDHESTWANAAELAKLYGHRFPRHPEGSVRYRIARRYGLRDQETSSDAAPSETESRPRYFRAGTSMELRRVTQQKTEGGDTQACYLSPEEAKALAVALIEAAVSADGDVILKSRAVTNHIWVDYPKQD